MVPTRKGVLAGGVQFAGKADGIANSKREVGFLEGVGTSRVLASRQMMALSIFASLRALSCHRKPNEDVRAKKDGKSGTLRGDFDVQMLTKRASSSRSR